MFWIQRLLGVGHLSADGILSSMSSVMMRWKSSDSSGLPGNDEGVSGPAFAEGLGTVDEGEVAISLDAAVALGALVDEDGADVLVEGQPRPQRQTDAVTAKPV